MSETDTTLDDLLTGLFADDLDDEGFVDLRRRLQADPAARRQLRQAARFEAALHRTAHITASTIRQRPRLLPQRVVWPVLAAAAAVLIAVGLAVSSGSPDTTGNELVSGELLERQTPASALAAGQAAVTSTSSAHIDLGNGTTLLIDPHSQVLLPRTPGGTIGLLRGGVTITTMSSRTIDTALGQLTQAQGSARLQLAEEQPCRSLLVELLDGQGLVVTEDVERRLATGDRARLFGPVPPRLSRHLENRLVEGWDAGTRLLVTIAPDGTDRRRHPAGRHLTVERDGHSQPLSELRPGARVALDLDNDHQIDSVTIRGHSMRGIIDDIDARGITLRLTDYEDIGSCQFAFADGWHILAGRHPIPVDLVQIGQTATCDLTTDGSKVMRIILPPVVTDMPDPGIDLDP